MKIVSILAGLVMLPVLAVVLPAIAQEAPTGQIEGGNIYRVANVTKGIDFTDPVTATCGDTVQFRVRVHNIGAFPAENVKVTATLPATTATSHSSMVTVGGSNTNTVTDTAGVNLNKAGKLAYVAGSTELLDANQAKLSNLSDGITGGGVILSTPIGVSIDQKRSVQFKAKVICETPPPPKEIKVCELATKTIITIKENEFDASKHTRDLSKCQTTPPNKIKVCELATKQIVIINESDFDAAKYTKDLSKCSEVPPKEIKVCELATKKIIVIKQNEFDSSKHSMDLSKCVEVPPHSIKVCELTTGNIIVIKENEFDANKHTRDLSRCQETPVTPITPTTPATPTASGGVQASSEHPAALVDTGTGDVLGVLAAMTAGGAIAYRLVWQRRFLH